MTKNRTTNKNQVQKTPSQNSTIQKMLKKLSSEDRVILAGPGMEHLSFEELEIITGKKAGSLRKQYRRLKDDLRERIL